MRQSHLFTKTRKEVPSDEVSKNAQLLIRAGYIHKEMAGAYSLLPLGLRVINKIANIIREEMNAIGGQEILLTALQDKNVWEKSGRWSDAVVDNWFKTNIKNGGEVGLGFTHEEPIVNMMREHISSYTDLPRYSYQIQTKFRNEERAKSGILRGREFLMKDLYSFSKDENEHNEFYEKTKSAYKKMYERFGIGDKTFITFASGGSFSKYSHEFQTISDVGEDTIYLSEEKGMAVNKEVLEDDVLRDLGLRKEELVEKKAIEVGNIFSQGTRFSEALGLTYKNEKGDDISVITGAYGIGLGRIMGTVVEVLSDDKGIIWPESISPFKIHLISLGANKSESVKKEADALYDRLSLTGVEVLYDDREESPGTKFADSDLLGIPKRVIISEKTMKEGKLEVKDRKTGEVKMVGEEEL